MSHGHLKALDTRQIRCFAALGAELSVYDSILDTLDTSPVLSNCLGLSRPYP
jgi:hypothetical protein